MVLERSARRGRAGSRAGRGGTRAADGRVILELVVGVDPAGDPDVRRAGPRAAIALASATVTDRRRREQPPDPVRRPEGAQDEPTGDERDADARAGR